MKEVSRERCVRLGERVLVVAHGDTVDGAVRAFSDEVVYSAQECGWVCFRPLPLDTLKPLVAVAAGGEEGGQQRGGAEEAPRRHVRVASSRIESMVM